jgi:hypothetical protein
MFDINVLHNNRGTPYRQHLADLQGGGREVDLQVVSNKPYKNPNYFAKQTGEDTLELDERMLVHHFDKLTGPLKTKGGIPVEAMKVIKQVMRSGSDSVANGVTCCSNCRQDIPGADFVECPICNKW